MQHQQTLTRLEFVSFHIDKKNTCLKNSQGSYIKTNNCKGNFVIKAGEFVLCYAWRNVNQNSTDYDICASFLYYSIPITSHQWLGFVSAAFVQWKQNCSGKHGG